MSESENVDHSAQPLASCGTDGEKGGESDVRSPKKVQDPRVPPQAEVDEHNTTHLPYRSWCTHCVRGRGEAHPHHKTGDEERDVPELHMDYCFVGKVDEKAQPIHVVKERDPRMMCSMLVGEKGAVDEHVIKGIIAFIERAWLRVGENRTHVGSGILREVGHRRCHSGQEGCTNHARIFTSEIFWEQQGGTRATESHEERPGHQSWSGHQGHVEYTPMDG